MSVNPHWDDAPRGTADHGPIDGVWTDLGAAAGAVRLGATPATFRGGDACFNPRTGEVRLRGLGVTVRAEAIVPA